MAILLIDLEKRIGNADLWRSTLNEQLPNMEVRFWPETGNLADIEYLAFMHPDFYQLPAFPNLKAMFSRSAGVETFARHPRLPKVPLGKVEPHALIRQSAIAVRQVARAFDEVREGSHQLIQVLQP